VTKGSRLRAELSVGGAAGQSRERSLGRGGVRERNPMTSPPPTQARARRPAPTISPSYDHRSSHGNRSVAREDDNDVITEHAGGGELTGYRFVDIELLTKLWAELGANTVKESRHGLASCFTLECADGETRRFWTSPEADSSKAGPQYTGSWGGGSSSESGTETAAPGTAGMRVINWMVTAGAMAIGKGATALRTLLGLHCDMPFNCNWDQFYRKCENIVGTANSRAGAQLADEVGKLLRDPRPAPRAPHSALRAPRPAPRTPRSAHRASRSALRCCSC
jgi:hypothetical protein